MPRLVGTLPPLCSAFALACSCACASQAAPAPHAAPTSVSNGSVARAGVARAPAPPNTPRSNEALEQIRFRLLEEQDTDCDQRITKADQGSLRFRFRLLDQPYEFSGTYVLSSLLDELSLARATGVAPRLDRVLEDPIRRTSRLIQNEYWPALTRRLDEDGLPRALSSREIQPDAQQTLYVPGDDPAALAYFRKAARRYDAAYAELARAAHDSPAAGLLNVVNSTDKQRELTALLVSPEGRSSLGEATRALRAISQNLDYPGLSRFLTQTLERVDGFVEHAARGCAQSSTARLGDISLHALRELANFSPRHVSIQPLPAPEAWPAWTATAAARHGSLSLALSQDPTSGTAGVPFVVSSSASEQMAGGQSYFILLGLLHDQRLDLARGLADNAVYVLEHYKANLAFNHSYYLLRSQPPFLSSMLRAVWEATPAAERDPAWLRRGLSAVLFEYQNVWNASDRRVASLCQGDGDARACLSRYAGHGQGQPPEAEPGHFDWLWQQIGRSLETSYASGGLPQRNLKAELDAAFRNERCMRESGHDATYRWFWKGQVGSEPERWSNRCADMVGVDLNSLLYKYEVDIAHLLRQLLASRAGGHSAPLPALIAATPEPSNWCARARNRFELMKRHLWSARDGLFYDAFLSASGPVQTGYVSATSLYPLWATALPCEVEGAPHDPTLSAQEQSQLVTNALSQLEAPGGLLASAKASRDRFAADGERQWEYPQAWAPHQMLAWQGLMAHGFREDAERLSFSWLYTLLTHIIDYAGAIPENYDAVTRTHALFADFGKVGAEHAELSPHGQGWMNASFQVGLGLLEPEQRQRLAEAVAQR
jgi:alpha,alpha-trehalase